MKPAYPARLLISKSKAARLLDMDRGELEKLGLRQVRLTKRKVRLLWTQIEALVERRTFAK